VCDRVDDETGGKYGMSDSDLLWLYVRCSKRQVTIKMESAEDVMIM
jgi:hypothetical protein